MSKKTLILNGSPRKNGDTSALVDALCKRLDGEVKLVSCYYDKISPCVDCRKCRENSKCAIDDEMQEIYEYIEACDNVVVASPIYFSELSGRLLDVASRFQLYFSAKFFRNEALISKPKKGAVILVGGGSGNPQKAYETAVCLLHQLEVKDVSPLVCCHNTDREPALNPETQRQIDSTADFLNE